MDQATYSIEHAKTARSKCKQCKVEIDKDQLRIGKHFPSERFTEGGSATEWRHPACLFQHLKRVKKTTKKVETEADLSGFVLLDESEQAEIRALIAAKDVPSPKKPKAPKAKKAAAVPVPLSPIAAAPPVADLFVCVLEPVAGDEESAMLKTIELAAGVHQLGRGESTGIDVKAVSRNQVELHVKADDRSVVFVRKGTNVSRLLRAGRDPLDAVVDQPYVLAAGDQFALLGDRFRYNVKTLVKSPPAPVSVSVPAASVPTPAASLPPLGSAPVAGGKELPSWMTAGAPASAPPTTTTTSAASSKPPPKPKAAAAKSTSLEPAKKKAKTTKKKKKDDDEEEDANEPNTYDLEDSFIDDDAPDEPPARDNGDSDASDDDDAAAAAAAGKKRPVDKISIAAEHDSDDGDDDDEDLGELAREARAFVKSGGITTSLPPCRYGAKCYRTNAEHLADFSHPPREVDMAALALNAAKLVPELSVEQRIDSLAKVYARIDRDVIRDMLAANGNAVSKVTELLSTMNEEAAE